MPFRPTARVRRRGYLPHIDEPGRPVFVTVRLADAPPEDVVDRWKRELRNEPRSARRVESLRHFDGERYDLHAWVVMPNHLHALLTLLAGRELAKVVGAWKIHTAIEINRALGRKGQVWQEGVFDRLIRNEDHFKKTVAYIHNNPRKAGLCDVAEAWPWSSASTRRTFKDCR